MLTDDLYKWHSCWVIRQKLDDGSIAWFTTVFRRAYHHADVCGNLEIPSSTRVWYNYKSLPEISDILNSSENAQSMEQELPPSPPPGPLNRIIGESDMVFCKKCKSGMIISLFGFGKIKGCRQPKCDNFHGSK